MNDLIKRSFLNAFGVAAYIAIVATVMQNAQRIFGNIDNNFLGPILFLMLFVLSAAITGGLVLGKPILMYIDGSKSEAVKLFLYTLGWIAVIILIIVANLLITK